MGLPLLGEVRGEGDRDVRRIPAGFTEATQISILQLNRSGIGATLNQRRTIKKPFRISA